VNASPAILLVPILASISSFGQGTLLKLSFVPYLYRHNNTLLDVFFSELSLFPYFYLTPNSILILFILSLNSLVNASPAILLVPILASISSFGQGTLLKLSFVPYLYRHNNTLLDVFSSELSLFPYFYLTPNSILILFILSFHSLGNDSPAILLVPIFSKFLS